MEVAVKFYVPEPGTFPFISLQKDCGKHISEQYKYM